MRAVDRSGAIAARAIEERADEGHLSGDRARGEEARQHARRVSQVLRAPGGARAVSGRLDHSRGPRRPRSARPDRRADAASRRWKSTRLNSSHRCISYAVFCLKKKNEGNKAPELLKTNN